MTTRSVMILMSWMAAAYVAAVMQVTVPANDFGMNVVLAVAAAWLCRHRGSRGVLGVAGAGLLLDALGNDRLGLHLGSCGVLAAMAVASGALQRAPSWLLLSLMAGWLACGDAAVTTAALSFSTATPFSLSEAMRSAVQSGISTAALVAVVLGLITVCRRSLAIPSRVSAVQLNNHWNRLTEA